jgi:hypothetical protein
MVRKVEDENRQLLRELEETRQRLERRAEAMRVRWIDMLQLPEEASERVTFLRKVS